MTRTSGHRLPRIARLSVSTPQGPSGTLGNEFGSFLFAYQPDATVRQQISLLMPPRLEAYKSGALHPVFGMNLPEGYLLHEIRERLAKVVRTDPLLLLAITGDVHPIGRLRVRSDLLDQVIPGRDQEPHGESLHEILSWKGTDSLFAELLDRYVFRSGISGVQPKVVVPERIDRARAYTPELIVKSGRDEYPHLALNEFLCMTVAKTAGLPVPEFWLSDNRELFVMRRFDSMPDGQRLGFEDFAALTARQPDAKYEGSYEQIARAVQTSVSADHIRDALDQLFDTVALSCAVGNGDAHLKNFGVLYTTPDAGDVRMSPVFDIVNTTMYLPNDTMALKLGGNKAFAGRARLAEFARKLGVVDDDERCDRIEDALVDTLKVHHDLIGTASGLRDALEAGLRRIERPTTSGRAARTSRNSEPRSG